MPADMNFYRAPKVQASLYGWLARSRRWDIEYGGYFSNHMAHNFVVLSAAGASEAQMQRWEDRYADKLTAAPARPQDTDIPDVTESNWRTHIQSTRTAFRAYRTFFDARINELGISRTLHRYLPALLPGLAGAAFHPLIHTGWGAEVGSTTMTAEGLAYMATAFQPLATDDRHAAPRPLWSPDAPGPVACALAFLERAHDRGLPYVACAASQTEAYQVLQRGGFQHRMIAFDDAALPLGAALNVTGPIGLPDAPKSLAPVIEEVAVLMAALLGASGNEFFVLHGLTSLHSALVLLPHLSPDDQRAALVHWWRAAMAMLVAQDLAALPSTTPIEAWIERQRDRPPDPHCVTPEERERWRRALHKALPSADEHVPKAVYVLWRWTEWEAFSPAAVAVFRDAVDRLIEDHPSGEVHRNLFFKRPSPPAPCTTAHVA